MGDNVVISIELLLQKLETLENRYEEINHLLCQSEVVTDPQRLGALAREQASLEEVVSKYREYKACSHSLAQTQAMVEGAEPEILPLIKEEIEKLQAQQQLLLNQLQESLLPQDPHDTRDVIMEIRAGAGGEEASLFAADLFRMYTRYAQSKGWDVEILHLSPSDLGGFKEVIFEVKGKGAYSRLKYERGVHRVQRVPVTEASGRIHTSTATVAVLPEAEEVEVNIDPEDLKVEFFQSSGPGGQHVNKVATAVRVTHLPTGITAICQDERSQLRNRMKAMALLRARLLDRERRRLQEEVTKERRSQVGTGERAEKIRTYNFPQNRVSEHRINLTLYNLPQILDGELDEIIDALSTQGEKL